MKRILILGIWCAANVAFAQTESDTLDLEEITVWGQSVNAFSTGSSLVTIKNDRDSQESLSDLLESNSSIYFKTYGNGQLSSIAIRGTSASHTAVLWNGIPINSPNLGQSDFSTIPTFFLDKVAVQKGGGSSIYGSGAIGGTVLLDNSRFRSDSLLTLISETGSFGWNQYGVKILTNNPKLSTQTKLIYSYLRNDFPFEENGTNQELIQENASVETMGFDEKIGWDIGASDFFAEINYVENCRETQPTKTGFSDDKLETIALRSILIQDILVKDWQVHNSIGFVRNATVFNENDRTSADQFSLNNQLTKSGEMFSYRFGQLTTMTKGLSDNYDDIPTNWHVNLNGSVGFQLGDLNASFNGRQHLSRDHRVFSPGIVASVQLAKTNNWNLRHNAEFSSGFRVPTFNDHYWVPGGNLDLKPERSTSYSTGQSITSVSKSHSFELNWNVFFMSVDDWILWLPSQDGYHSPLNIQKVLSRGVEVDLTNKWKGVKDQLIWAINYAFTKSTEENGIISDKGKQLPYTPLHRANASLTWEKKSWNLGVVGKYTSVRYTTLDNTAFDSVSPYFIADARMSKSLAFANTTARVGVVIQNLANADYENLKNRAMPGRNFKINLNLKF